MTLMLEAPPAPGTALAVIHNPALRGREHHRIALECTCTPDVALAVLDLDSWDAMLVLGVHAQHMCAIAVRDAHALEAVSQP
jgi:hypothetical protein